MSVPISGNCTLGGPLYGTFLNAAGIPYSLLNEDLPLDGGTMSGNINMNTFTISDAGLLQGEAVLANQVTSNLLSLQNNTDFINLRAPLDSDGSYTLSLPVTLGVAGQVLSTDGAGATDWVDGSSGSYLQIAGGTMEGDIAMNNKSISGANNLTAVNIRAIDPSSGHLCSIVYQDPTQDQVFSMPATTGGAGQAIVSDGAFPTTLSFAGPFLAVEGGIVYGALGMNNSAINNVAALQLADGATYGCTVFQPPTAPGANLVIGLPVDAGVAGALLSTDGAGNTAWVDTINSFLIQTSLNGATVARPGSPVVGQMYFDTDIGLPIWWDGIQWISADGAPA